VIDPDSKISASVAAKLSEPIVGTPVLSLGNGVTMRDAIGQLLTGLGYQVLPADQSIVIQEEGVSVEANGDWMVLAPEVSNKTQEMYVINLTEKSNQTPGYLKSELAKKGLHLREVALKPDSLIDPRSPENNQSLITGGQTKSWPRDKQELVDALLLLYGVTFGVAEKLPGISTTVYRSTLASIASLNWVDSAPRYFLTAGARRFGNCSRKSSVLCRLCSTWHRCRHERL